MKRVKGKKEKYDAIKETLVKLSCCHSGHNLSLVCLGFGRSFRSFGIPPAALLVFISGYTVHNDFREREKCFCFLVIL